MSNATKCIDRIKGEQIANTRKRILLLEGDDDVKAFRILLDKKCTNNWEQHWSLASANGKKTVLDILRHEPTWIGLVDRDEWSDATITEKQAELQNLCVLPRYCLENYLINPDSLWVALPLRQKNKIGGGATELRLAILLEKDKWLRHGVLWSIINPLPDGLWELGFKDDLLDVNNAQDNKSIKIKLKAWHDYLNPDLLFGKFTDKLLVASHDTIDNQLHIWIHGKKFYENVVHSTLNRLLKQTTADFRKFELFQSMELPDDLAPLWTKMGL